MSNNKTLEILGYTALGVFIIGIGVGLVYLAYLRYNIVKETEERCKKRDVLIEEWKKIPENERKELKSEFGQIDIGELFGLWLIKKAIKENKTEEEYNTEFKKAIEKMDVKMYKALEIWESKRFEKLDKRLKKLEESMAEQDAELRAIRKDNEEQKKFNEEQDAELRAIRKDQEEIRQDHERIEEEWDAKIDALEEKATDAGPEFDKKLEKYFKECGFYTDIARMTKQVQGMRVQAEEVAQSYRDEIKEYKALNKQWEKEIERDRAINQKMVETIKMIKEVEEDRDIIITLLKDGDEETAEFFGKLIEPKFEEMRKLTGELDDLNNLKFQMSNPDCVLKMEVNDREIL